MVNGQLREAESCTKLAVITFVSGFTRSFTSYRLLVIVKLKKSRNIMNLSTRTAILNFVKAKLDRSKLVVQVQA